MVSSTALVVAGSAGAGAPAAPAAPATCATFDSPAALEAAVARSSRGAGDLFGGDDAFAPAPPVADALRAKIASKVKGDFGDLLPVAGGVDGRGHRGRAALLRGVARGGARRRQEAEAGAVAAAAGDAGDAGDRHVVAYEPRAPPSPAARARLEPVAGATGVACGGSAGASSCRSARAQEGARAGLAPAVEARGVVSGHLGWVRSVAFEPRNEWFATGGADRTIKIWDLAKCAAGAEGGLKLTLTGTSTRSGLAVSARTTYMFSAGEDKKVMCWDLETNKVVRHYHGHLSGVYSLAPPGSTC
ncbi:malonyl-CoA decarboxylase [Aureococcus anophagefferens]|nr:malonyl-CoA decarboxylase [Aureococcus anophagefferens]